MTDFLRTWFTGYTSPARFVAELQGKPAPYWGAYAQHVPLLLDLLLLCLPLTVLIAFPQAMLIIRGSV
jgi:hypothetical protein